MELGEKIRKARLEAGLTQRQLCGGEITRNMLSLIENGSAKPSMKTLQYLAAKLEKSVSYFLEDDVCITPNQRVMETIRRLYDVGEYREAALALEAYEAPDEAFDREWNLLYVLVHLELAQWAVDQKRTLYARELLQKADRPVPYCQEALNRRRLLLTGRLQCCPVWMKSCCSEPGKLWKREIRSGQGICWMRQKIQLLSSGSFCGEMPICWRKNTKQQQPVFTGQNVLRQEKQSQDWNNAIVNWVILKRPMNMPASEDKRKKRQSTLAVLPARPI